MAQGALLSRFVMFVLASNSRLRIVFFHSHFWRVFFQEGGSVEKEKLADNPTQIVFEWSWTVIRAVTLYSR